MNSKRSWCIKHVYAVIFMFMWVLLPANTSSASKCIEREREALLAIKKDLVDEDNRLSSWSSGGDCCKWEGVYCDSHSGHVLTLDLANPWIPDVRTYRALRGKLSPKLIELRNLTYFDLSYNKLQGDQDTVSFIGALTNLRYLDLSYNQFCDGQIIYKLGNLTHLEYLNLALSCFGDYDVDADAVQNLDSLPNHHSLRYLDLSGHNLSRVSDWLEIVNKLPNLRNLTLNGCDIPPPNLSYTNTTSKSPLASVTLSDNPAISSSSIFKWLFNYNTTLVYLRLPFNHLTLIPDAAFRYMTSLVYLDLSYNGLSGPIPAVVVRNITSLVYLDLSYNNLSGPIPADAFRNMRSLSYLSVSYNNLSGPIPPNVFRTTTSLEHLSLSGNELSGSIPDAFGNMSLLRHLDLSRNLLDGVIPQSIGQMDSLETLDLSYNSLVGLLPDVIKLFSLRGLYLHGNHLSGPLSEIIEQLSFSLEILDLGGNQLLSGRIPESIGNLSSLIRLDLSDNRLSGKLPDSIGQLFDLNYLNLSVNSLQGLVSEVHFSNLSKLVYLDLADNNGLDFDVHSDWNPPFQLFRLNLRSCKLGPDFPKWLATQKRCSALDVSHADISDVLPNLFWSLFGNFDNIDFSHNDIRGTFGNLTMEVSPFNVREVHFGSNQMEGQMPSFLSNVSYLDLSNNTFSEISSFLCASNPKIKMIEYLDLSSNHVVEELPNCWTHLVYLQLLDLSNNAFSGIIPSSIGSLFQMETLKLRSNRLVGEFPSSLMNCTNLRVIDLADNKFSSSVPEWIGDSFPYLVILLLQSNRFSGSLPRQLCHLTHIQILDLSENEISGTIPSCLDGLTALAEEGNLNLTIQHDLQYYFNRRNMPSSSSYYEDEVTFIWKGSMSEYKSTLGLVKRIDFSSNRLTGEIPSEVTRLVGLISLNLSQNNLSGHIPPDIGMLESLDSLDLSRNQIGGKIPASLGQIHRLGYLDLSNNSLSGEIPTGTQIQGFDPSVFAGNPHLCGLPLPNMCASDETNQDDQKNVTGDQEDTDKFITTGFYISLALGFVVGFWGVCGSLNFKRKWRYAYYRFLDVLNGWFHVKVTLIKRQFKD